MKSIFPGKYDDDIIVIDDDINFQSNDSVFSFNKLKALRTVDNFTNRSKSFGILESSKDFLGDYLPCGYVPDNYTGDGTILNSQSNQPVTDILFLNSKNSNSNLFSDEEFAKNLDLTLNKVPDYLKGDQMGPNSLSELRNSSYTNSSGGYKVPNNNFPTSSTSNLTSSQPIKSNYYRSSDIDFDDNYHPVDWKTDRFSDTMLFQYFDQDGLNTSNMPNEFDFTNYPTTNNNYRISDNSHRNINMNKNRNNNNQPVIDLSTDTYIDIVDLSEDNDDVIFISSDKKLLGNNNRIQLSHPRSKKQRIAHNPMVIDISNSTDENNDVSQWYFREEEEEEEAKNAKMITKLIAENINERIPKISSLPLAERNVNFNSVASNNQNVHTAAIENAALKSLKSIQSCPLPIGKGKG